MEPDNLEVRRTVLSVLEVCSNCKCTYELDDARIVGRNGNLWVLTVTCSACNTQAFVAAVVGDSTEEADIAVTIDDEPDVPLDSEPVSVSVTVDDVLDIHEFLEDFNGDFRSLFARRAR